MPIVRIASSEKDSFLVNCYLHLYISILKHCAMITQRKLFQQKEGCLMRNKKIIIMKTLTYLFKNPYQYATAPQ